MRYSVCFLDGIKRFVFKTVEKLTCWFSTHIRAQSPKNMQFAIEEGIPYVEHTDAYLETIALQRKLTEALFARDVLLILARSMAPGGSTGDPDTDIKEPGQIGHIGDIGLPDDAE